MRGKRIQRRIDVAVVGERRSGAEGLQESGAEIVRGEKPVQIGAGNPAVCGDRTVRVVRTGGFGLLSDPQ